MTSLLLALVIGLSGYSGAVRCEPVSPPPRGYFAHGLTLTADGGGRIIHVAEVFPKGARHNTGTRPIVYFYRTVSRDPEYKLDATRLWTGELVNPVMPLSALVSTDGYFVTLDEVGNSGGERSLVIYAPDGRLVRSLTLDQLFGVDRYRAAPNIIVGCGRLWRDGTTYHFSTGPDPKLYIVSARGPVVELTLKTGAVSPGNLAIFAKTRDMVAQGTAIQPELYTLNLLFSSITDTRR